MNVIKINKIPKSKEIEFEVVLTSQYKIRLFVAKQLIKLAGVILGCGIKVND